MSAALAHLAARVAGNPRFMAHPLGALQRERGLSDGLLVLALAMPAENLDRLRLCGLPRPDRYHEDLEAIAAYAGADPARLAEALRAAEGLTDA